MDPAQILCQLCARKAEDDVPFYCCACAQNLLYESRIQIAGALLSKETAYRGAETAIKGNIGLQSTADRGVATKSDPRHAAPVEHQPTEYGAFTQRTNRSLSESSKLREELVNTKAEVTRKKATLARRKDALQSAQQELVRQEKAILEPLNDSVKQAEAKWNAVHVRTSDVRMFLCKEIASLYGLLARKRRRGGEGHDEYLLGQIPIIDLRDLNSGDPHQITASVGRTAHFVYLAAHYLSIRLPAEILLPSPSHPHASVLPPLSSYKEATLANCMQGAETQGATALQRVLYLDRPLSLLASDDQVSYSLFVDAVTLLAWDVAWLARAQGLEVGIGHWEEICAVGKTLWSLFGPSEEPHGNRAAYTVNFRTRPSESSRSHLLMSEADETSPESQPSKNPIRPGFFSHGSARTFLSASESLDGGAEFMRAWQFANPLRLVEKIKGALASERMGAEWELLEKEEWIDNAGT